MRKIIASTFMSVDGVMQAPGGPEEDKQGGFRHGGWQAALWEDEIGTAVDEIFHDPFDLLLGRRTYDIFAAHWPFTPVDPAEKGYDEGMAEIALRFARIPKYVAPPDPDSLTGQGTQWWGEEPGATLRRLKRSEGPNLLIQGSSDFVQTLLAHGLIDRYRLIVAPLVLGRGKRLFGTGTVPSSLTHLGTRTTPGGTVIVDYKPKGPVQIASFEMETPTPEEFARREKMAAESIGEAPGA